MGHRHDAWLLHGRFWPAAFFLPRQLHCTFCPADLILPRVLLITSALHGFARGLRLLLLVPAVWGRAGLEQVRGWQGQGRWQVWDADCVASLGNG